MASQKDNYCSHDVHRCSFGVLVVEELSREFPSQKLTVTAALFHIDCFNFKLVCVKTQLLQNATNKLVWVTSLSMYDLPFTSQI
jgi:hypothetical protein